MHIVLLALFILAFGGFWIGFLIRFSRAMREGAGRAQQKQASPRIKWLLTVMGVCLLVASLVDAIYTWQFTRAALRTDGVVVELRESKSTEGSLSYAPTFRFQDSQGTSHTIKSRLFTSPARFRVGDTVEVFYRANEPDSARVEVWTWPLLLALIGGAELVVGLILFSWPQIKTWFREAVLKTPVGKTFPG